MADTVQIKAGAKNGRPTMPYIGERQLGYESESKTLSVGYGGENVPLGSADSAAGKFPLITIKAQTAAAAAPVGSLFEDTDGALKYKNLAGVITELTGGI